MMKKLLICGFWFSLFLGVLWVTSTWQTRSHAKSINIYTWTELIDRRMVDKFEKETGISVNMAYFESNEELYAKLKITKGVGYDLVLATDYIIQELINDQLLQPIDQKKLDFMSRLDRRLLHLYCDPTNRYSVPYLWSLYGIGINRKILPHTTDTWGLLLDPAVSKASRLMTEDARELALIAALYLYGSLDDITEEKVHKITELLLAQKPYVTAYTDYTSAYLLASGTVAMALASSPYVLRVAGEFPEIDFMLPREGTFALVENFVIPATSNKHELIYKFLNFIYQHKIISYHVEQTYFFPAVTDVECNDLPARSAAMLSDCARHYKQFNFFRDVIPEAAVNRLWLTLKTS